MKSKQTSLANQHALGARAKKHTHTTYFNSIKRQLIE